MTSSPADLFLSLWATIEADKASLDLTMPPTFDANLKRVARSLVQAEPFDMERAVQWTAADPIRALVVAQAIDNYYAPLSEGSKVVHLPTGLRQARRRLRRDGWLANVIHGGSVILRRPLSGRWSDPAMAVPEGEGAAAFFDTLLVAPPTVEATSPDDPSQPSQVSLRFLSCRPDQVRLPPTTSWKVGLAPVTQELCDLAISNGSHGRFTCYDSVAADLTNRIFTIVQALCEAGCHLIAFPEMALSPATLDALKAAVAIHGPNSQLMLVLAGSTPTHLPGADRPFNRSCTLNHRGEVLFSQDKLARWNLTTSTCDRYGLDGSSGMLMEHIEVGTELVVAELPGLGRFATLICEDLGRTQPGSWIRKNLLLDLQFTPVMDSDLHFERWSAIDGSRAAYEGGCRVLVASSLPLSLMQNDANAARSIDIKVEHPGIGLFFDRIEEGVRGLQIKTHSAGSEPIYEVVEWDPSTWNDLNIT